MEYGRPYWDAVPRYCGPAEFGEAPYRRSDWDEIEPIYRQPWAESIGKAVAARKANAPSRNWASGSLPRSDQTCHSSNQC